jgi:ribonuclease HI
LKETVAVAAWYIWWQRRHYCKGEHVVSPSRTALAIFGLALNYGGAESGSEPRVVGWEKPVPSCYKLNVDAYFFPNGTGSVAAVLRDHKGRAVAGKTWIGDNFLNATTAEASALLRGLQLVEDLGCAPVIIESDCLELVQAFNGEREVWSPYSAILSDCYLMAQGIGNILVQHCPREANGVAHTLARYSFNSSTTFF